jgi:hypothetical protein
VKRRILIGLAASIAVALTVGYAQWFVPTRQDVAVGNAMLAKQICSCIFVAGRSLKDCRADQFESMDPIQVEVRAKPPGVRAFVPLFGERSASWSESFGCTLE